MSEGRPTRLFVCLFVSDQSGMIQSVCQSAQLSVLTSRLLFVPDVCFNEAACCDLVSFDRLLWSARVSVLAARIYYYFCFYRRQCSFRTCNPGFGCESVDIKPGHLVSAVCCARDISRTEFSVAPVVLSPKGFLSSWSFQTMLSLSPAPVLLPRMTSLSLSFIVSCFFFCQSPTVKAFFFFLCTRVLARSRICLMVVQKG